MTEITHDKVAAVDRGYHYRPIDKDTPMGVKMLLANKDYGVATIGSLPDRSKYFTHWSPLPTFRKD